MLNLVLILLIWSIFIALNCTTLYFTTLFTLRAWHCYKNIKVDPINAIKKKDTSVAKAEELKSNYEKILELG